MKLAKMVRIEKWEPVGHEGGWHFCEVIVVSVKRLGRMWVTSSRR